MTIKLSFGGCVFDDLNGDGIALRQDANGNYIYEEEPGIAGVTVRVVDSNGNPVSFLNSNAELISSTTTDSVGVFRIFGLPEGEEYKLQFDYSNLDDVSQISLSPANVVVSQLGVEGSELKDSDGVRTLNGNIAETDLMRPGVGGFSKVNLGLVKDDDPRNGVIGNEVFADTNGNGIKDNGEQGIEGVSVTLTGAGADGIFGTGDDISESTVTSSTGRYRFGHLAAGDYKVTFDKPAGLEFTEANVSDNDARDSDANVDTGMTDVISLAAGERNLTVDAGLLDPNVSTDPGDASIGDFVFEDVNGNGLRNSNDNGIANVEVFLLSAGADGVFGTSDDRSQTTFTAADGSYSFNNLNAGDYKVTFTALDGFEFTQANVGNSERRDSDADVTTGMTDVITLAESEQNDQVDAGLVRVGNSDPGDASIGDFVFEDVNGNGLRNSEDNGIANVEVFLLSAGADGVFGTSDDRSQTTFTAADGSYSFNNLNAGNYKVTFDQPDGFEFTQANVGDNERRDSDADVTTGMTDIITLAASEQNDQVDAGLVRIGNGDPGDASIGNLVFEDANGNGLKDGSEVGIEGVQVTLSGAGADGIFGTSDDISESTVTNQNGNYSFRHLDAGDYKVTFEQADGFNFTEANVGTNESRDSDANTDTGMTDVFSLAASERNNQVDAGLVKVNTAPDANNDAETTAFETPVNINVLGNDSDPDGDTLTVTSLNGQAINPGDTVDVGNGTVTLLDNGQFSFTPDAGFSGNETFSYHVSDGNGGEDTANVTVTVEPKPNTAPDANNDTRTTAFDETININVLGNDNDPDGDTLTVTSIAGQAVNVGDSVDVGNGIATLLANGQISFDPDANFSGDETFSYHVSDGNGGEDTANVTVTVEPKPNTAPDANNDTRTTAFDETININVLGNDADPDGDTLTVTSIAGQAVNVGDSVDVGNGIATLLANGQISFDPDANFSGDETFSYHVSDGNGGEDTANVTVTVEPRPNTAPDANNDSQSTDFETPVNINVLGNDSDPDGDTLTVTSLNGQAINPGDTVDVGNGTVTLLDNGQFSFTPDDGFSGNETFSYHVSDGNGGEDTANVTVTVAPKPNTAPNARNDSRTTAFDQTININVLGNDNDPDGDTLTVTSIAGQTVNVGDSVDVGNGIATLLANGQIGFDPDANFSGNETFSYHVSDGNGGIDTAHVTVTVEPRPRKNIHASIVGAGGIDEGQSSHYKVQLDHAVTEDTVFTLDVHNGSATRVDRNDYQAANQDIMWGGYYSVGYVDYHGNWVKLAYYVDDRVANGTSISSGDRAQVGPDGYTTWDYTVEKNGHVQNGGTVEVLVRAGQTMSETFEVQTWKEKVTVDRAPWSIQEGYYEGTENFSIKIDGVSGNDLDDIKLGSDKTVNIFDKTHYAFVSPIALDLNGDGVQTTALGETTGTFDLRGDGNAISSGWLSSEDAFLVVDHNGNGTIDDISEMFGGDVGDGFAKLATYDTNGDGLIDTSELLGGGLALWRDANSNHSTDAGELISLGSQGITSLDTAFVETPVYQNGNVLIEHGSATKADGSKVDLVDAYFQVADTSGLVNQEVAFS